MNLLKSKLSVAIAAGLLSGPALAATINCTLTPANSVITQGETLQLAATCEGGPLASIKWSQGTTALTGDVLLSGDTSKPIYYTAPAGAAGDYIFTVEGMPLNHSTDAWGASSEARVLVSAVPATNFGGETTPSSPTDPVDAACGSAAISGTAVQSMPTNGQQCDLSKGKPALAITGPSSYSWSCISLTGGAEANCYVPRGVSYTVTANAGANGTITPSGSQPVNANTTTYFTVAADAGYNIASVTGCNGSLSGSTFTTGAITGACSVSATFAAQASSYNVTATAGTGGSISPAGTQTVNANTNTSFTVTANNGYTVAGVSGCNGTLAGSIYTTGAIASACTVAASFAADQPPPGGSSSDPGIGSGLWVPPNTTKRTVADQSGDAATLVSYVPGCLNGLSSKNSSSGCSLQTSFEGTIYGTGTNKTVTMGSGNQLVLRYKTLATAGSENKYIRARNYDGGNVGVSMRVWLSTDPSATYASVAAACKQTSTRTPMVITGPGYCPLSPNTVYYFGIEYDENSANRFQIDEVGADFQ